MKPLEILIIVLAALLVAFTVGYNIYKKKKGKSSCGCAGCSGCAYKDTCASVKKEADKDAESEK